MSANLLSSLEAATSRLEDIASSTDVPNDIPASNPPIASPSVATAISTPPAAPAPPKPAAEAIPESIEEFDNFLSSAVDKYVKLSNQLGGLVAQQVRPRDTNGIAYSGN